MSYIVLTIQGVSGGGGGEGGKGGGLARWEKYEGAYT